MVESRGSHFTVSGVLSGFNDDGVKLYTSTDEGQTWSELVPEDGLLNQGVEPRALFGNDSLLIFSARRQVIMSKDAGLNWTSIPDITSTNDESRGSVFAVIDNVILAGTADDTNDGGTGIYRKEGDGPWELITEGLDNDEPNGSPNIVQIAVNNGRVLVSASDGFYISDDKGLTYTRTVVNDIKLRFVVHGNTIVALGTGGGRRDFGLWRSTDNGSTFEEVIAEQVLPSEWFRKLPLNDIVFDGTYYYISTSAFNSADDGGVWVSTDLQNWSQLGLAGQYAQELTITENYLYSTVWVNGGDSNGLHYIALSDVTITSNEEPDRAALPAGITLHQNYPNPFNPATVIAFDLSNASEVTLDLFNLQGQRVSTLIRQSMTAGRHSITLDGSTLSSGTYIYRLQAGETQLTKTMTLVK